MWRNWQTRGVQVAVGATPWRFESSHPHRQPSGRPPGRPFVFRCRFRRVVRGANHVHQAAFLPGIGRSPNSGLGLSALPADCVYMSGPPARMPDPFADELPDALSAPVDAPTRRRGGRRRRPRAPGGRRRGAPAAGRRAGPPLRRGPGPPRGSARPAHPSSQPGALPGPAEPRARHHRLDPHQRRRARAGRRPGPRRARRRALRASCSRPSPAAWSRSSAPVTPSPGSRATSSRSSPRASSTSPRASRSPSAWSARSTGRSWSAASPPPPRSASACSSPRTTTPRPPPCWSRRRTPGGAPATAGPATTS